MSMLAPKKLRIFYDSMLHVFMSWKGWEIVVIFGGNSKLSGHQHEYEVWFYF